ncbi:MAG TPA: DUF3180 domain-containing protein [Jatrophihabitans sp.]|nr:DUF3180 domain-containing protein [Jatrophihabitans sp.]
MSDPGMRRTGWFDLAVPFVIVGVTAYVLLRYSYDSLPTLHYLVPLPLAALAVVEFVVARRVRAAVRHDPDARPMEAIGIARCVALGKASSLVAAAVAGAAAGLLGRLLPDVGSITAADHDAQVGGLLFAASVLLVVAGLLLERAGIDPGSDQQR